MRPTGIGWKRFAPFTKVITSLIPLTTPTPFIVLTRRNLTLKPLNTLRKTLTLASKKYPLQTTLLLTVAWWNYQDLTFTCCNSAKIGCTRPEPRTTNYKLSIPNTPHDALMLHILPLLIPPTQPIIWTAMGRTTILQRDPRIVRALTTTKSLFTGTSLVKVTGKKTTELVSLLIKAEMTVCKEKPPLVEVTPTPSTMQVPRNELIRKVTRSVTVTCGVTLNMKPKFLLFL